MRGYYPFLHSDCLISKKESEPDKDEELLFSLSVFSCLTRIWFSTFLTPEIPSAKLSA